MVVMGIEIVGHLIFPPPPGLDASNPEALKAYMQTAPLAVLLFVFVAWCCGAFFGGWLAALIARRAPAVHALIVGGFILLSGVATMLSIPHPLWFWIAGFLFLLPLSYAGSRLVRRRPAVA
jgi:hypothetical protein